jgi:hypothetical protein
MSLLRSSTGSHGSLSFGMGRISMTSPRLASP